MSKCSAHHIEKHYHNGYLCRVKQECWGTRERDECSCDGDRTKCDFYPEIREKVLKEIESKFGEWISVEDRLPKEWESVLVWSEHGFHIVAVYLGVVGKWRECWNHTMLEGKITHWMPLPQPPKGE